MYTKLYAVFFLFQMEKVEEDLIRSKSLRENQAKEFSQQLEALRQKYEQQVSNFRSMCVHTRIFICESFSASAFSSQEGRGLLFPPYSSSYCYLFFIISGLLELTNGADNHFEYSCYFFPSVPTD